jgi:hypothetical protein
MAFQLTVKPPERQELVNGNHPHLCPGRIENRRRMPLRQDKTVIVGVGRILRVIAHNLKEEGRNEVCRRETRGGVTGPSLGGGPHRMNAYLTRFFFQQLEGSCWNGSVWHGHLTSGKR